MKARKIVSGLLALFLTLQLPMAAMAQTGPVSYDDGQKHVINDDVVAQPGDFVAVAANGDNTIVIVTGDVEGDFRGVQAQGSEVIVEGDVYSDLTGVTVRGSEESSGAIVNADNVSVIDERENAENTTVTGVEVSASNSTVTVESVSVESNALAYGVHVSGNENTVKIEKDVIVDDDGVYGAGIHDMGNHNVISVGGSVISDGDGVVLLGTGNKVTVSGDIEADGFGVVTNHAIVTVAGDIDADIGIIANASMIMNEGAKFNDIPKDVEAIIRAMDAGSISAAPIQFLENVKPFSKTVRIKTKGETQVYLYATRSLKNPSVIFYDIKTGEWSVLDVTIDPATGLLVLTVPGSGIVQVVEG